MKKSVLTGNKIVQIVLLQNIFELSTPISFEMILLQTNFQTDFKDPFHNNKIFSIAVDNSKKFGYLNDKLWVYFFASDSKIAPNGRSIKLLVKEN